MLAPLRTFAIVLAPVLVAASGGASPPPADQPHTSGASGQTVGSVSK